MQIDSVGAVLVCRYDKFAYSLRHVRLYALLYINVEKIEVRAACIAVVEETDIVVAVLFHCECGIVCCLPCVVDPVEIDYFGLPIGCCCLANSHLEVRGRAHIDVKLELVHVLSVEVYCRCEEPVVSLVLAVRTILHEFLVFFPEPCGLVVLSVVVHIYNSVELLAHISVTKILRVRQFARAYRKHVVRCGASAFSAVAVCSHCIAVFSGSVRQSFLEGRILNILGNDSRRRIAHESRHIVGYFVRIDISVV